MTTESTPTDLAPDAPTRAGYVALIGAPNAGKSTLMNALVGEHLSIVTPKAQTTWRKVAGILTEEGSQLVFIDTPGLLNPGDLLQRVLLSEARQAIRDADLLLVVLDPTQPLSDADAAQLVQALQEHDRPLHVVVNKKDLVSPDRLEALSRWAEETFNVPARAISALKGDGLPELLTELRAALPESPFFFPDDEIATDPVRFFVGEMVRETVFENFHQEIPYSIFTQVGEFRQGDDARRTFIEVTIFVERRSQKGILIGEGGGAIRELGTRAREKVEHFLGEPVYLELWVKVLPGWRKKRPHLKRLGFSVPDEDERH